MIKPALLRLALVGAALAFAAIGCIQVEQATTLYPDGSGKLCFTVAVSTTLSEMGKAFGGEGKGKGKGPAGDLNNPTEIIKKIRGIVAWGEPKTTEDDEWTRIAMVGYFEDINQLKIYKEPGDAKPQVEFTLAKTDKGFTLSASDESTKELSKMAPPESSDGDKDGDDFAKKMMAAMKPMFKGLKMGFSVTVPGAVTESSGFLKTEGRTVSLEVRDKDIFDMMDGKKEAAEKFKNISSIRKIEWAEATVTADEQAAFKKELEQAKETWKQLEAEWKKKAAEKKAEEEKKEKESKKSEKDKEE